MGDYQKDLAKTQAAWGSKAGSRTCWKLPPAAGHIAKLLGGDGVAQLQDVTGKKTFSRALSLGCGHGESDRGLARAGIFAECVAIDVAPGAIAAAQAASDAEGLPISYVKADLNKPLPATLTGQFDLVYGFGSLHHIDNLESLFRSVSDRMTPDGALMFQEYCGPSRFQWRERTLKISNAILDVLPAELKGEFQRVQRAHRSVFEDYDPSEAIRSAEIMDLCHMFFNVQVEKGVGFTLVQPLLNPIAHLFDDKNEMHQAILRLIFLMEELLMDANVIESDVKFVVARKRG